MSADTEHYKHTVNEVAAELLYWIALDFMVVPKMWFGGLSLNSVWDLVFIFKSPPLLHYTL